MRAVLPAALAILLAGCVSESERAAYSVRDLKPGSPEQTRRAIAVSVIGDRHFGGWSIIGKARLVNATISGPTPYRSPFVLEEQDQYCVSADVIVAGITQRKVVVVSVTKPPSVLVASIDTTPGNCAATNPFPELERLSEIRASS
jgi:hypothetical protein